MNPAIQAIGYDTKIAGECSFWSSFVGELGGGILVGKVSFYPLSASQNCRQLGADSGPSKAVRSCNSSLGAVVPLSIISLCAPPPLLLPASKERVRDVKGTALLTEQWWIPVVSARPNSLNSIPLKNANNYTQKMCGDSSGKQHVKYTGMKLLKLPKKTNKSRKQWILPSIIYCFATCQYV